MNRSPKTCECPVPALDWADLSRIDFADAFSVDLDAAVDARDAARQMVAAAPRWIKALMVARNMIVAPLGLRGGRARAGAIVIAAGTRLGPFHVTRADATEVLVAADDRHLDARLALLTGHGHQLIAATAVAFNGRLGRAYFAVVKPFHRRIVPALLRSVARAMDANRR